MRPHLGSQTASIVAHYDTCTAVYTPRAHKRDHCIPSGCNTMWPVRSYIHVSPVCVCVCMYLCMSVCAKHSLLTVRVQHGNHCEHKHAAQLPCQGCVAQQHVKYALTHPRSVGLTRVHTRWTYHTHKHTSEHQDAHGKPCATACAYKQVYVCACAAACGLMPVLCVILCVCLPDITTPLRFFITSGLSGAVMVRQSTGLPARDAHMVLRCTYDCLVGSSSTACYVSPSTQHMRRHKVTVEEMLMRYHEQAALQPAVHET